MKRVCLLQIFFLQICSYEYTNLVPRIVFPEEFGNEYHDSGLRTSRRLSWFYFESTMDPTGAQHGPHYNIDSPEIAAEPHPVASETRRADAKPSP